MSKFNIVKELVKKNKELIIVVGIVLICSVAISIGVYSAVTNKKLSNNDTDDEVKYQTLKQNFNGIFNNEENEYISIEYDIEQEKQRRIQC